MPPWMGPVTIGLGTVGLSTSCCDPAAGPLPLSLEPSARALPAVTSPTASAPATSRRVLRPDPGPVMRHLLWRRRGTAPVGDYVADLGFPARASQVSVSI